MSTDELTTYSSAVAFIAPSSHKRSGCQGFPHNPLLWAASAAVRVGTESHACQVLSPPNEDKAQWANVDRLQEVWAGALVRLGQSVLPSEWEVF